VGIVHLRVPESHTASLSQSIGDTGLRSEGGLHIQGDQHTLRCRVLLARSLPGQSVPIGLVKATCFLCVVNQWPLGPIDPRMGGGLQAWVVHSPGAPTAMVAINAFLCEVCWRVLENTDYSSGLDGLGH